MSPLKKATETMDKIAKYHCLEKDQQVKDGANTCPDKEHHTADTAKVLDATVLERDALEGLCG